MVFPIAVIARRLGYLMSLNSSFLKVLQVVSVMQDVVGSGLENESAASVVGVNGRSICVPSINDVCTS